MFTGVCLSTGGAIPACFAAGLEGVSRPTAKGEVEGDLVQAHTQGGSGGGSGPGPHPRGKLRQICLGVSDRGVPAQEGCLVLGGT